MGAPYQTGYHELTKGELAAMREATTILFYHQTKDEAEEPSPHGRIALIKEQNRYMVEPGDWQGELRTEIPVPSYIETYSFEHDDLPPHKRGLDSAYSHHKLYTHTNDELGTVVRYILKPGDQIRLLWRVNSTQWIDEHGICRDELLLEVKRTTKSGKSRYMQFLLEVSVGPDNSVRMIRRSGQWVGV